MNLSELSHTWFIDIDGTILDHNGYKTGEEKLLPGVKEFWSKIPEGDCVVLVTGRPSEYDESTIKFLRDNDITFDHIMFNMPLGERIIINDTKPSGLQTAIAINLERNKGLGDIL